MPEPTQEQLTESLIRATELVGKYAELQFEKLPELFEQIKKLKAENEALKVEVKTLTDPKNGWAVSLSDLVTQRANTADAWKTAFILLAGLFLSLTLIIFGLLTFVAMTT
jgi:hypothetical protein